MKKAIKMMLLLFVFTFLGACTDEAVDGTSGEDGFQVGYAINNLNDTFQTYVLNAAEASAEEHGIEVVVENAEEDLIRQQDQVNALIQNGVDGLVVVPVDTSAMQPITDAAQAAGIPLVYVNRNPYGGQEESMPDNVFFVGSEEITAGMMQMEFIGEQMNGEGGIGILLGILGNEATTKRTEGVKQVIEEQYPDISVLAEETAEWQRDQAISITENWILTYGEDINAIVSNNDEMALGALQAIQNNGRDDMFVIGIDAIPDALEAVEAGELAGTVFQDAEGQGGTAMDIMNNVLQGEAPEENVKFIPFELVTSENVTEFK